jgi:hypothetical protein
MWILQPDGLIEIPDDAPVPPGSKVVDVPDDFDATPDAYVVTADGVRRRTAKERQAARRRSPKHGLTAGEVAILKQMIKERAS